MTKNEALKMCLEYIETDAHERKYVRHAIKEALAQPEQTPVAWVSSEELLVMRGNALGGAKDWRINVGLVKQDGDVGLYTTPPQRTWVGLTDEEIDQGLLRSDYAFKTAEAWRAGVVFAMTKLKEKNT